MVALRCILSFVEEYISVLSSVSDLWVDNSVLSLTLLFGFNLPSIVKPNPSNEAGITSHVTCHSSGRRQRHVRNCPCPRHKSSGTRACESVDASENSPEVVCANRSCMWKKFVFALFRIACLAVLFRLFALGPLPFRVDDGPAPACG